MTPVGQLAGEPEPDDRRYQHRDRLAEQGRLGLDAADPPAEDAEPVLHGGVRVGAHAGIRVGLAVGGHDHPGQVLDVHLVHDPGARRHHLEAVERLLAPAQEAEPLGIPLELQVHVAPERVRPAEHVRHHRVIDDQLGRDQRVDRGGVAAQATHGLAHGGQVHHGGHAGEVLHDHARRGELDLGVGLGLGVPAGQRAHVVCGDVRPVLGAQQVLQQDLQAERQRLRAVHRVQPAASGRTARRPAAWPGCRSCPRSSRTDLPERLPARQAATRSPRHHILTSRYFAAGFAGRVRGCRGAPARARSTRRAPGSCPCRSRATRAARSTRRTRSGGRRAAW